MALQASLFCFLSFLLFTVTDARKVPDYEHNTEASSDTEHYAVTNVLGGWEAPSERFPYVCLIAYIGKDGPATCGGVLVAPQWVMTAAHCLHKEDGVNEIKKIACGIHKPADATNEHLYNAADVHIYEMYNPMKTRLRYDLAMVKLDRPTDIELPLLGTAETTASMSTVYTVGWGEYGHPGELSEELRATKMYTMKNEECKEAWIDKFESIVVEEDRVCTGGTKGKICYGDSGGPLLVADSPDGAYDEGSPSKDIVVGIASFGECEGEYPSVFTRVSHFTEWIKKFVGESSSKKLKIEISGDIE